MARQWGLGAAVVMALAAAGCSAPADPEEARPEKYVEPVTISQAATDAYGDGAKQAYTEIADLVMAQSLQDAYLDPQRTSYTRDELSQGIVSHMVPTTRTIWYGYVDKALAGDKASEEIVDLLRVYNINAPQLTTPPDGKVVTNQAISNGKVDVSQTTTSVSTEKPLQISFEHSARLSYLTGRAPYLGTVDRTLTFVVVPADSVTPAATETPSKTGTAADSSSSATPPASVTASTSSASPVAADPNAKWLITHFDGTNTLTFDDATGSPTGATDSEGTETSDAAETSTPTATP